MTSLQHVTWMVAAGVATAACGSLGPSEDLIFLDGRGVAAAGDSLVVITRPDSSGVVVIDRRSGMVYQRAANALSGPQHVQFVNDRWYVSDVRTGQSEIVVFDSEWKLLERISIQHRSSTPHQFAVLPDDKIVVEAPDGRLAALDADTLVTFALTDQGTRTGLLIAALGGVLHAVPDRAITLYNGLGKVRWRLPWPWHPHAYPADLTVDPQGRFHLLVGEGEGQPTFVAFTLSSTTGEVIRWSVPGVIATFSVDRVGNIEVDNPTRWLGDQP